MTAIAGASPLPTVNYQLSTTHEPTTPARQFKKVLPSLCLEAFPFAKPFYWAGFICSGLS